MQVNKQSSRRVRPYFNDFEELLDEKEAELERAALQQADLRALREGMLEIDCDHGVANLEVDSELIRAVIDVANVGVECVDRVLNDYNWNRKFDVCYSQYHNTVVFEMVADINRVCEDAEID